MVMNMVLSHKWQLSHSFYHMYQINFFIGMFAFKNITHDLQPLLITQIIQTFASSVKSVGHWRSR